MTPRRIVLVLPDPPLPFGNAAARWFWVLLTGLVDRGHDVTAYVVYRSESEREATVGAFPQTKYDVRMFEESNARSLLQKWKTWRRPYAYPFSDKLRKDLALRLSAQFDVLHLEQIWTGWLGWDHRDKTILNIHYLLEIDLEGKPPKNLKDRLLQAKSVRAERSLLQHYPNITTLTPRLTRRVREIAPQARVDTVPLAIDIANYPFHDRSPELSKPVVTLIGSFDWHPGLTAGERLLKRLWPDIKRQIPAARLQLVGRNALQALGRFADPPDVSIVENVPDILPYFTEADVLVYAPTKASGMKVKILESFALGLPVVTTPDGVEGIPAVTGVHAEIAGDDPGLVSGVLRLLGDAGHWAAVRQEARQLVTAHCNPQRSLDSIVDCYDAIGH